MIMKSLVIFFLDDPNFSYQGRNHKVKTTHHKHCWGRAFLFPLTKSMNILEDCVTGNKGAYKNAIFNGRNHSSSTRIPE